MEAVMPAAPPGAPDGARPEANSLLHLVPSRLPVCLCGPKPPEPGQQALLSPVCGQPAWRGIWGLGRGSITGRVEGYALAWGPTESLGGLGHAGLSPLRAGTHCHTGSFCALPTEDATKAGQRAGRTRPRTRGSLCRTVAPAVLSAWNALHLLILANSNVSFKAQPMCL